MKTFLRIAAVLTLMTVLLLASVPANAMGFGPACAYPGPTPYWGFPYGGRTIIAGSSYNESRVSTGSYYDGYSGSWGSYFNGSWISANSFYFESCR